MAWVRAFSVLLAIAWAASCRSEDSGPTTGSETHFLSWCSSDDACDDGLTCVCGVCTAACTEQSACAAFGAGAECLNIDDRPADQICSDAPSAAACEAECGHDAECETLGAELRCDRGFCRQLAAECARGEVGGAEVVLLGDSFFGESREITTELERLARSSGALDADESYRDHATTFITPFGGNADLASQYAAARDEGAVRVAILTTGGPDLISPGACPEPPDETCAAIQNALAGSQALFQQMADDGVDAIVDVYYPDTLDASLNERLAVFRPLLRSACASSPVPCHFVDLAPTFEGQSEAYLLDDGINPSTEGAIASAAAIWSSMQRFCLAQ